MSQSLSELKDNALFYANVASGAVSVANFVFLPDQRTAARALLAGAHLVSAYYVNRHSGQKEQITAAAINAMSLGFQPFYWRPASWLSSLFSGTTQVAELLGTVNAYVMPIDAALSIANTVNHLYFAFKR